MATSGRDRAAAYPLLRFHDVESPDGTVLRAWTNGVEGPDVPTVLLCNGLGTNPYAWPGLLDPACGVRVVSWNHRGVGGSQRPRDHARVDMDAFVEDACAVMADAGLDAAVLVGWSMGVNLACEIAARTPAKVTGLLAVAGVPGDTFATMLGPLHLPRRLVRPFATTTTRGMWRVGWALTPFTRRIPVNRLTTTLLRHSGFMLPAARPEVVRDAVGEFLTTDVDWYMHLGLAAAEHPRVSLSRIRVPTTFVAGRWDLLAGAREMRSASERIPGARYVEVPGSHFLPLEEPALITTELHALLRRVG